jgi:cell fate regulator YaaT (PSP1 superfamily)
MPDAVGIKFETSGKVYGFKANGLELKRGELVVVESDLGVSIGRVISENFKVDDPNRELKPVLRKVTEEDLKQDSENNALRAEAREFCIERIMARGLPMKLVATEVTLDRKRIIFYFVAETRIDFRELVKDLAAKFKTRIELRQIGVRDEAKMIGGIGLCGRTLCCKSFLSSFEPISIKMAKQQELVLNTCKLSGLCGRLMCCLSFECDNGSACEEAISKTAATECIEPVEDKEPESTEPVSTEPVSPPPQEQTKKSFRRHRGRRWRKKKKK